MTEIPKWLISDQIIQTHFETYLSKEVLDSEDYFLFLLRQ